VSSRELYNLCGPCPSGAGQTRADIRLEAQQVTDELELDATFELQRTAAAALQDFAEC
jgi:hypothetical protein